MGIEYHGWIVLATSRNAWSDGDCEDGFQRVREAIQTLTTADGHDPVMPQPELLPQVVYFKGSEADSIAPVLKIAQKIGDIFDKAYGELVVFDEPDANIGWDFARLTRWRLGHGRLVKNGG